MSEFCRDSPLTIIENIISILTFVLGVLASYLTFYTLTRHALSEIETFKQDLEDPEGSLHILILALTTMPDSLLLELEGLESEHFKNLHAWWGHEEVWKRMRWMRKRKEISQRLARISRQKMEVEVSQMTLLLKYALFTILWYYHTNHSYRKIVAGEHERVNGQGSSPLAWESMSSRRNMLLSHTLRSIPQCYLIVLHLLVIHRTVNDRMKRLPGYPAFLE